LSFWDRLLEELRSLGESLVEWIILLAIALLVLIIGRWVLKWVRKIIVGVMDASWLDNVWDRSGVNRALGGSDQTAASITGTVVYAYLMVGLWLIVTRILKLDTIEELVERLLLWIPTLLLAVVIVIIAAAAANWTADLIRPFAEERGVAWLTWGTQIAIILFGVLFALDVLEFDFAEDVTMILFAAFGVAVAIAFGVGGIDSAKLWWAKYAQPGASQRDSRDHAPPPPPAPPQG